MHNFAGATSPTIDTIDTYTSLASVTIDTIDTYTIDTIDTRPRAAQRAMAAGKRRLGMGSSPCRDSLELLSLHFDGLYTFHLLKSRQKLLKIFIELRT